MPKWGIMNIYTVKKLVMLRPGDCFLPADEYQKERTKHISEKIEGSKAVKLKAPAGFKPGELLETDRKFTKAEIIEHFEAEPKAEETEKPKRKQKNTES